MPARIGTEGEAAAPREQERATTAGIVRAADREVPPVITPSDHPRLQMSAVRKRFGATVALDGVDLTVRPGEVHALIGENGAGKSTLVKILSGAIRADEGDMRLDGRLYRPSGPLEARQCGIAMIYQELNLAGHLTVEENVMLGIEETRWGLLRRTSMRRRVLAALRQLRHPDIRPDVRVRDLSLGAQQLVEVARALASDARILVMDEPTSSLTQEDTAQLFTLIRRLRDGGVSVIYISHFLEEVRQVADRFTVLRDGRVTGTGAVATTPTSRIIERMVGRALDEMFPRVPHERGGPALRLDGLSGDPAPIRVDLTLHRGEILGLAGLIGAGRTELVRTIFGLDPVRAGRITVAVAGSGWATDTGAPPHRRLAQGVGMLSEDRKAEGLALPMSLADNITLSRLGRVGRWGWLSPARQKQAARRWIDRLNIRFIRYFFGRVELLLSAGMKLKMKHALQDLVTPRGAKTGFHVEHILSRNEESLAAFDGDEERFDVERNRLGGVLLLKGKDNISSSNELYAQKLKSYANTLYWNETLRADTYHSKLDFRDFVKEHQLAFKALDKFGPDELEERQRLLFELSALIWSAPTVSAS